MDTCYFEKNGKCEKKVGDHIIKSGAKRINTIIECSKKYGDGFWLELVQELNHDKEFIISVHKNCVSVYTNKHNVERFMKHKGDVASSESASPAKIRRSSGSSFDIKKQCLFCGKECKLDKDPKNPSRWRPAYQCRHADKEDEHLREEILKVCTKRHDTQSAEVRLRVLSVLSDFHAADARYHRDCKLNFLSPKAVSASEVGTSQVNQEPNASFEKVLQFMLENKEDIWNSIDLFDMYTSYGGDKLTRRQLISSLSTHFGDELLILSASGVASIVVFKKSAPKLLKLVSDQDDSDIDIALQKLSKVIELEHKNISINKNQYEARLGPENIENCVSMTMMRLLAALSKKFNYTPSAYLIANMIASACINHPTLLQIDLGVMLRNSKKLVNIMNAFGVTCSYDEVLQFKKSAAVAATKSAEVQGISSSTDGLIQVIVDNFDADISSQNGKLSTHSLAMLVTQPEHESNSTQSNDVIKRLSKSEMTLSIDYNPTIESYSGPKKPDMPRNENDPHIISQQEIQQTNVSVQRAKEMDLAFLTEIVNNGACPEYNGYNTQICREQGHGLKPKTRAMYLPLIDTTPSDPDTIKTALCEAQEITKKCGQDFVVFTGDLQLYKVAVNVIWASPEQFDNVVLRLGGMHTLMSFVGSIGSLMSGSGLFEVLESTFGGVLKMMSGKKFLQNMRALRIVAEEILRPLLTTSMINSVEEFEEKLEFISGQSRTARLWVDCVIKSVSIMMRYVRAEREADWLLHLQCMKEIIPYFFAAGHVHYARYGLYYLRSMENMPEECRARFLKGEHTMRHIPGIWNGLWSDMFIESTFMRYGHGNQGIIGVTLKPETLKTWSLSLHTYSQVEQDIVSFIGGNDDEEKTQVHKEEMKSRILADNKDRDSIRDKLKQCIDPMDPEKHPDGLINISTGKISDNEINCDKAVDIGSSQMKEFEKCWPEGFHSTISKQVKTQAESKKYLKVDNKKVFDTELIYSRVIGLQASAREVKDVKQLLSYELSPVPTSMFTDAGDMRTAKSKSVLKNTLKKESSSRGQTDDDKTIIIDGSAVLYVIGWPKPPGTVQDYIVKFRKYIEHKVSRHDVYLVFDRYTDYSIKGVTRAHRGSGLTHSLALTMPMSAQNVLLGVTENKQQLIALIVDDLSTNTQFRDHSNVFHRLIITGEDPTPIEVTRATTILRADLKTTHEEADNILVQQMVVAAADAPNRGITVISDDTDVFVLLLYFYKKHNLSCKVIMESPVQERTVVDIGATVGANNNIIDDLPAAHALSGSDTTACYSVEKEQLSRF